MTRGGLKVLEARVKELEAGLEREKAEHRKTAEALQVSEKNLNSILGSATGFAIYRLTYDKTEENRMKVDFVSPSISHVTGIDPAGFTADAFYRGIHPDDLDRVVKANDNAFETHGFDETFRFFHRAQKAWVWIHAISNGVWDNAGKLLFVNGIFIDVTARQKAEKDAKRKAKKLEDTNTTLNVLIKKREQDRMELEDRMSANLDELVLPYLRRLNASSLSSKQKTLLDIAMMNLSEVASTFAGKISTLLMRLTPSEIKVANLIRHGQGTKEIADILNVSEKTVETHRQNIRRKVGITNKQANLRTFLLSLHRTGTSPEL